MADLDNLQAAQTIKVAGSDSSGSETNFVNADADGSLYSSVKNINNQVSTGNSTSTPLAGNATFTGTWEDVSGYLALAIMVNSNVVSADSGWKVQWSTDGVNIDHEKRFSFVNLTSGQHITLGILAKYCRIVFINGSSAQASFRLQTIFFRGKVKNPAHSVVSMIHDNDSAEITKAVITGKTDLGNWRNVAVDEDGRIMTSGVSEVLSPLPGFVARSNKVLTAGQSILSTYVMTDDIALIDFHFGGRGPGQAAIFRVNPAAVEFVPGGGFNSSGDVSMWTNASAGSSALATWTYDTAQKTEGTGSARLTFTQSDSNNFPAIRYTWSTPKDVSAWRYINADVYVTLAAGGNQTRQTDIILTDVNGATRTYTLAGNTVNSPVYPQNQFNSMIGEIESPTSSTGTFDPYNVTSITLRLLDGGNKTGTIYWDNVRFTSSLSLIERIYIDSNRTFQLVLNPAELFDVGETLGLRFKNNDTVSREFTVTAKGVLRD